MKRRTLFTLPVLLLTQIAPRIYKPPVYEPRQRQAPTPQGQRRAVVPVWVVEQFHLEEAPKGALTIASENGRYYALDDVLFCLFQLINRPTLQRRK